MGKYKFGVYEYRATDANEILLRKQLIVLKDENQNIVGWTDFHKYARSGKRTLSRSIYAGQDKRCVYVSEYALSSSRSKLCVGESIPCEYGGYCYSARTRNEDYSECYKVTGPAGEMGYCPNCDYYRGSDKGFYDSKESVSRNQSLLG